MKPTGPRIIYIYIYIITLLYLVQKLQPIEVGYYLAILIPWVLPICKKIRILRVFWKIYKSLPNYLLTTKSLGSPKLSPCDFPKCSTYNESKLLIAKSSNKKISNIAWVLKKYVKNSKFFKNSQVFSQLPINN